MEGLCPDKLRRFSHFANKNNFSAEDAQSSAEGILNRFCRLCKNKISFKKYNREFIIPDYIMVGLQKDGIIEKIDALFAAKNNY